MYVFIYIQVLLLIILSKLDRFFSRETSEMSQFSLLLSFSSS